MNIRRRAAVGNAFTLNVPHRRGNFVRCAAGDDLDHDAIFSGGSMKTASVLALALMAMASSASAQAISGRYQVQGKNFNGTNYSGTAEIVSTANNTCRITWVTGSTTSRGI